MDASCAGPLKLAYVEPVRVSNKDRDGCSICLDPILPNSPTTTLLPCGCPFHQHCVEAWLSMNGTCPTCRLPCANYPFLKKLKQSPEDINTQREVLNAVYQTAMVEGVGKQTTDHLLLLGKEGACEITCGLMKGRQEDRSFQILGAQTIEALVGGECDVNKPLLEAEGTHVLIAEAMQKFEGDREVLIACCHAITGLATNDEYWQGLLSSTGCCSLVCRALKHFPDLALQLAGVYSMNALTHSNEKNLSVFAQESVGGCLVMAMMVHDDMELRDGCLTAITNLAGRSMEDRNHLGVCGACHAVMISMLEYPEVVELQLKCCYAIAKLGWTHLGHRETLRKEGATALITHAMARHSKELPIQIAGSRALVSLYSPLDDEMVIEATDKGPVGATQDGKIEKLAFNILVKSLAFYPHQPDLEVCATPAMIYLAAYVDGKQPMLEDLAGASLFVRAMHNYVHDEDTQQILIDVAISIAEDHEECRGVLAEVGIGGHLKEILGLYTESCIIVQKCLNLVNFLLHDSKGEEAGRRLFIDGVFKLVIDVVVRHVRSPEVVLGGLVIMKRLTEMEGKEYKEFLRQDSIVNWVFHLMEQNPRNDDIVAHCLEFINVLLEEEARGEVEDGAFMVARFFDETKQCWRITDIMKKSDVASVGVVQEALASAALLTRLKEGNARQFLEGEGIGVVIPAVENYVDDYDGCVQMEGMSMICSVLSWLGNASLTHEDSLRCKAMVLWVIRRWVEDVEIQILALKLIGLLGEGGGWEEAKLIVLNSVKNNSNNASQPDSHREVVMLGVYALVSLGSMREKPESEARKFVEDACRTCPELNEAVTRIMVSKSSN